MILDTIFQTIISFIQVNGYFLLLIGMIIEGPIITTTFSFAASLGYFNIFIILLLSILGDIFGDFLHFVAGRFIGKKFKKKIKLNKRRLSFIEKNLKNHLVKTLVFLKMIPPITSVGLLFVGSSKIRFSKLILASFLATIPLSIFYVCLGYFFGSVAKNILDYMKMGQYAILAFIVFAIFAYFLVKIIGKNTEKIEEKFIK
jgi:membrane protein DedA with SNARE-associated domain